jgi:hypothetical protein
MSIKTVFEKIGSDFEGIFKGLFSASFESKALAAISYTAPFLEGIVAIADPAIAPLVTAVVNGVTADLNTVKTVVQQGTVAPGSSEATQITAALNSVKTNLSGLLAEAGVKNSTKVAQITAAVGLVNGEVDAVLGEAPAAA